MATKVKLKKGDKVIVIAGRDKGKKGEVVSVLREENRVIVSGVNLVKRHTRPSQTSAGGILEKALPIHISNVAFLDPKENAPTRIGYKVTDGGKKQRVAKRSGQEIDV